MNIQAVTFVRSKTHYVFAGSEHLCAFCYAACEFWNAHHFLKLASVLLLASALLLGVACIVDKHLTRASAVRELKKLERDSL
jgi:hypothetical protein